MKECKTISIDSSSSCSGYAVFINGVYDHSGILDSSKIKDGELRMKNMVSEIFELLNKEHPDICVTEMTVVSRNAQAQRMLTMILGSIYGWCLSNNCYYYSFRPTEWRSLIDSGKKPRKREELKLWSISKVKDIFELDTDKDDLSDAILVGCAYMRKFK